MITLKNIHHIAIICSDYEKSKTFYTEVLGFSVINEIFRENRNSYKCDLSLNGIYVIELFSFPNPPKRMSHPESTGLRHLAFSVENIELEVSKLKKMNIQVESIRLDENTNKKFTFFSDPDHLPIELYEI